MSWRKEEEECFILTRSSEKSIANATKGKIKESTQQVIYKNAAKYGKS